MRKFHVASSMLSKFAHLILALSMTLSLFIVSSCQHSDDETNTLQDATTMTTLIPHIEINPTSGDASHTIIWLHGLGASGDDFVPVVPQLGLPKDHQIRFIFPHAPQIPVTINGGMVMPAWYDIVGASIESKTDLVGILSSAKNVQDIIDHEISRGIESKNIIIAGFSQGGVVSYEAALTYKEPLAGLLALSTYFPTASTIKLNPANQTIPVSIFHGSLDPMVQEDMGHAARQTLQAMGYKPDYHTYPIQHEVSAQEIQDIGKTIRRWFSL